MVIFKENKDQDVPILKNCVNCKASLGIEKKDIIYVKKYWCFVNYNVEGFICPICNTKQELK